MCWSYHHHQHSYAGPDRPPPVPSTMPISVDSSQDVATVPKVSNFPDFFRISETDSASVPNFPNTDERISPLDIAFNDPSLRNYPPPVVSSSAVQSLSVGQPVVVVVKRTITKRQADQNFPNFFEQSQLETGFSNPQFPDTASR